MGLPRWKPHDRTSIFHAPQPRPSCNARRSIWEVGSFTLSGTKNWTSHSFNTTFSAPPLVFLTAQTANGANTVSVRAKEITTTSFKAALFEQETFNASNHQNETIGYLAISSLTGSGTATIQNNNTTYTLESLQLKHKFQSTLNHSIKLEEERSQDK